MNDEFVNLLRFIAHLYYEKNLDQTEIANIVGISRSKVSRMLTKARELGVVQIHIQHYYPRNHILEEQLKEKLNLHHAIVINTIPNATPAQARRTIGYLAAPFIAELIQSYLVIGTAGGRTLNELIRRLDLPLSTTIGGVVLTLMGHIGPNVTSIDALELSYILSQRFGKTQYTLNAPAFCPDAHTRDVFMNHEQVRTILNLFRSMDLAMVGIGALNESVWIERGIISAEDLDKLREAGAVGEMVGRFFDKNGQECCTEYQDRVISIPLNELAGVKEVIAVTNGPVRADAILAARKGDVIKSLVIDDVGARAVLDKMNIIGL